MAILFSQADGSDQHYDTYEEFEKAMLLMARLGGNKPPQDLIDEAIERQGTDNPKSFEMDSNKTRKVIAVKDGWDITKGKVYDVIEGTDATAGYVRIVDDAGDEQEVGLGERIGIVKGFEYYDEDTPKEHEYKTGDIIKVLESFEDPHGDVAHKGDLLSYDDRFEKIFVGMVFLEDNEDKITLVCRAENREDK